MQLRTAVVLVVGAILALTTGVLLHDRANGTVLSSVAPVNDDYTRRDATIAFLERQIRSAPEDQIQMPSTICSGFASTAISTTSRARQRSLDDLLSCNRVVTPVQR